MPLGAEIQNIKQNLKAHAEGTVIGTEVLEDHIEVEVRLGDGREIWTEMLHAVGGVGGGLIRVPQPGESVKVGLIDGDFTNAYMLGWLADQSTPLPDVETGKTYLVAPDGEDISIQAGDSTVEISPGGSVSIDAEDVSVDATSVDVEAESISLGGDIPVPRADKITTALNVIWVALLTHIHPAAGATPSNVSKGPTDTASEKTTTQ